MRDLLERLVERHDLSADEAELLALRIAAGDATDAQCAAVLAALRSKGETADELLGFARAMRRTAVRPDLSEADGGGPLLDIVGTGGDGSGSLNLSTGAALLAAACGLRVAKHGNRSISGRCGSADLIEALGLSLPLDAAEAGRCLRETGFAYLFAPYHHPATARLSGVRRSLGIRTIFNLLGPLTNPAQARFAVIGAASEHDARLLAGALAGLEMERAFVVHGAEGWDEPTPVGEFLLLTVRGTEIVESRRTPEEFGLRRCTASDLRGGDARHNAGSLREAFGGRPGPHRDALILGAALALEVTGIVPDLRAAAARAATAIDSGDARRLLTGLVAFERSRGASPRPPVTRPSPRTANPGAAHG